MSPTRPPALILGFVLSILVPAGMARAQNCPNCGPSQAMAAPEAQPGAPCATCQGKCQSEHHCPKYYFTQEKMPCIKFCRVCSKPIAEPCNVADEPGYGYYPTCWRPMGPLNYTHCTVPPPAILAQPPPRKGPAEAVPEEAAPPPNRVGLMTAPRQ
jgi:hypothetical protein